MLTLHRLRLTLCAAFVVALGFHVLMFYMLELGAFVSGLVVILLGIAAMLVSLLALWRTRNRSAAGFMLTVCALWLAFVLAPTRYFGAMVRFSLERSTYEASVAELKANGKPRCAAAKTCLIDAGSPSRIVFTWGGLLDNWVGVVYDESGYIMDVEKSRDVFGGKLSGCELLRTHYYFCTFT